VGLMDDNQDLAAIVRQVAQELGRTEQDTERARREELERRVDELLEENRKSRQMAEEAQTAAAIREELQRAGVAKIDLAFRAIRGDFTRTEDGRVVAAGGVSLSDYVARFVNENPELLPARIAGGSGLRPAGRAGGDAVELDRIRPGMSKEEMEAVRREIVRLSRQG
jgi:hypothetical protein